MARTYISLFSCAGVGCYGFKMNNYDCIASNELLEPRIAVQRVNHKCKYESGYICGDATSAETHKKIFEEIELWRNKEGLEQVDVVFATPPCQGMSTANYKKTDHEQIRNSLVVQAIKIIKEINPKVFVFENVRAFMKSICTDASGEDMLIKDSIYKNLSEKYNIYWKVINFKDYGVPSSRPRTIVIGTSKRLTHISPLHVFPVRRNEITLRESIGSFARLAYCEKDAKDPFHFARPFPEYMLDWIKDLKEGETAFDNPDETKPCTFDANGNRVINKGAYMGNKYRRLIWDKPGACIATRSDVMSSQDTIHPCDNRVLSIRELMTLMTIPNTFRWTDKDEDLTVANSEDYLREHEGNIRRCIGEAVPTHIGYTIAKRIKASLDYEDFINGVKIENISSNFYASTYNLLPQAFDVQMAFEKVCQLNSDVDTVKICIENKSLFFGYLPLLTSYFSHIDELQIDVLIDGDNDTQCVNEYLDKFELGTNVKVRTKERSLTDFYNVRIDGNGCSEYNRLMVQNTKKTSKNERYVQLSLFDF